MFEDIGDILDEKKEFRIGKEETATPSSKKFYEI